MHGMGYAWQGDMCGKGGHVWWGACKGCVTGACVAGAWQSACRWGMCGRGCMAGGMHDRGHAWHICPPVNRMTDRCKNITLPNFIVGGNKTIS